MSASATNLQDLGLLALRVGTSALLFYGHGWPKLAKFSERLTTFADPLGVGSPISFGLVLFAEVVCATLVAVGLATRFATVPLLIFFAVAFFIQHADDPFKSKELALVYAVPYLALLIAGPGRYSLDARWGRGR